MNDWFRQGILRWCVVTVIIVASGCAVPLKFQVSVPKDVPPGPKGEVRGENIRLYLDRFTLDLQLQNYASEHGGAARPLCLWLEIGSTPGGLTFDPAQVKLTPFSGNPLEALSVLGPSEAWQSPRAVAKGCGPRRYSLGWAVFKLDVSILDIMNRNPYKGIRDPRSGPVTIEGKRCFLFWFDTDPSPNSPFVVSIGGLSRDGAPVIVPDVHFAPGTVRRIVVP